MIFKHNIIVVGLFVIITGITGLFILPASVSAASFAVNTTTDSVDANLGDGTCANSGGQCSLRAAIQEANALSGTDTITLGAQTYTLTLTGTLEDLSATGDLDITEAVTITGAGSGSSIIDGNATDRIFHITANGVDVTMSDLTIRNGNPGLTDGSGGGISNQGDLILNNVVITGNTTENDNGTVFTNSGGGIFSSVNSTLTITNSTISNNISNFSAGGGIASADLGTSAVITITDSSIINNQSLSGAGGGIYSGANGSLTIERSVISGNETLDAGTFFGSGGGIYDSANEMTLINVTISGNTARSGGGIYNFISPDSGNPHQIINSTIVNNNATDIPGSGIYSTSGDGTNGIVTTNMLNTIVADNTGTDNCEAIINSLGNNLENTNTCDLDEPSDIINSSTNMGPLASNGGPTQTHALLVGSVAIDGANNTGCPVVDQRSFSRPIDGDTNGSAICDIGAYEYNAAAPTPTPTAVITNTPVPTSLPTPTSSSSSSSGSGISIAYATCSDTPPSASSDLFQVDRNGSTATLYFTPAGNPVSYYFISYGTDTDAQGYGVQFNNPPQSGVISYTVRDLNPAQQYYFRVRAGNGCSPGPWSNNKSSVMLPKGMPNTGYNPMYVL